ncbi:MAG: hypothetical protein ACQESP_05455 [Candidatus Muiribacteriota bacterium]
MNNLIKKSIIYSLIIAFFSSIIFFVVTYATNNERVALFKTVFAFPAFTVVYFTLFILADIFFPGLLIKQVKSAQEEKKKENIDYIFPEI